MDFFRVDYKLLFDCSCFQRDFERVATSNCIRMMKLVKADEINCKMINFNYRISLKKLCNLHHKPDLDRIQIIHRII